MFRHFFIAAAICFVFEVQLGNSYRILGIFPTPSVSHQVVFRALTLALNERGHELVVITTDPIKDQSLNNYTEIDLNFLYHNRTEINFIEIRKETNWLQLMELAEDEFHDISEQVLSHPRVRKLYAAHSNEKFDLMLVESLYWSTVLPLAKRFDVPVIGITSLGLSMYNHYLIGNPMLPSHESSWELESRVVREMSFWRRLENFIMVWRHLHWYTTSYMARQNSIARKYFGNDIPDLVEFEKNISLNFVNQQGPISYARPRVPKVIDIGGFHVSKKIIALPEGLQKMLDEATTGFVYMSLGTNAKSTMMPNKTKHEFITAFSRLPYKVLWKFEDDILPGKPDNVHIMKWVPQQSVLAHPNLKVFVYQGGLQSTEEAVAHAVPLVGFPALGDQDIQVAKMVSLGVALKLEITAVDGNELYEAITTVASDSSYKQRMLNLRSLIADKPHDPLENAIWWTEYVIRHRGAPHLHSSTADEPWYSRQDMDIVAFISAAFATLLCTALFISCRVVKRICICTVTSRDVKSKMN